MPENNKRALNLLLCANAISQFAQGISMIAIPWYFIHIFNMESAYNWLFIGTTACTLIWAPYAGTLIDKYPRKTIFLSLCTVGGILLLTVASSKVFFEELPKLLIAVVFFFTVLNYNIHYPSLYALAQEITHKANYGKTNSLLEIQGQATSMLSGAMAAVLISGINFNMPILNIDVNVTAWPIERIFLMDGCTYVLAIILIKKIHYTPFIEEKIVEAEDFISRLKAGFTFLKLNPKIFWFGLLSYFVFVTVIVHVFYTMPLYVSNSLLGDGTTLATSEVFHTAGALLAGLGINYLFKNIPKVYTILVLMGLIILVYLAIFSIQSNWVYWLSCWFIGFANSGIRIMRVSYLFEMVPNYTIGRVTSVFQSSNILLRIVLMSVFHLPLFLYNAEFNYLVAGIFILIAFAPLLYFAKGISSLKKDDVKRLS